MSLLSEVSATVVQPQNLVTTTLNLPIQTVFTNGVIYTFKSGTVSPSDVTPINNLYYVIDDVTGQPMDLSNTIPLSYEYSTDPPLTGVNLNDVYYNEVLLNSKDPNTAIVFDYGFPFKNADDFNNKIYVEYTDFLFSGTVTKNFPYYALIRVSGGGAVTGGTIKVNVKLVVL